MGSLVSVLDEAFRWVYLILLFQHRCRLIITEENLSKGNMNIKPLVDHMPHPSYGTWDNFIKTRCEIRDSHQGVVFYGAVNCNYIVFPDGTLIENFGYHGAAMMARIREVGAEMVLAEEKRMNE